MVAMNSLLNKKVLTSDAYDVGSVGGFDLDTSSWAVTHIEVVLNTQSTKELGMRKPLLGGLMICIPVSHVTKIGDLVTINLSFDQLKMMPECKLQ
jgi:sporulation protein YlmC with PRC-barrel domain